MEKEIEFLTKKLSNSSFVDKAPAAVVDKTRQTLQEQKVLLEKTQNFLA